MATKQKPLKPMLQYSAEEWMKFSKAEQLERYNDCVHNMKSLLGHLSDVMVEVRTVRTRLERRIARDQKK